MYSTVQYSTMQYDTYSVASLLLGVIVRESRWVRAGKVTEDIGRASSFSHI